MVIVDSTVWMHYWRTPDTPTGRELRRLLDSNQVSIVGLVISEVLQGARDDAQFSEILSWLSVIPYLEISKQTWVTAARLSTSLRLRGQMTPLSDLVIAAMALEGDHQVYTLDEHFQRVPGLRLYEANAG